jgi:hypothetical protein
MLAPPIDVDMDMDNGYGIVDKHRTQPEHRITAVRRRMTIKVVGIAQVLLTMRTAAMAEQVPIYPEPRSQSVSGRRSVLCY